MFSPSRTNTPRGRRDGVGRVFIGAVLLLGLTASILLVFSDNLQYVRIGLVVALWAAVIGALAATRYRKEAAVDQAKAQDLQKVYELQLEREVAARREYELGVEARVRAEVGVDGSEIAALRAELTVLRQNLQQLFAGGLPEDRPALQADALRVEQLTAAPFDAFGEHTDAGQDASTSTDSVQQSFGIAPSGPTPVYEPGTPAAAGFASPADDPVTAETAAVTAQELADYAAQQAAELVGPPAPEIQGPPRRLRGPGSFVPEGFVPGKVPEEVAEYATAGGVPADGTGDAAATAVGTAAARRRHQSEPGGTRKLTVAEIMENLRTEV